MGKEDMMIPYIAYESMLYKEDTQQKRMVIVMIVLVVLLVVTNAMWLYYWNLYDYVDDYVEIDSGYGGDANYIGEDGDIYNGKDSSKKENEKTP